MPARLAGIRAIDSPAPHHRPSLGAVLGLLAVTIAGGWMVPDGPAARKLPQASRPSLPGGDFTMTDHRGRTFTQADLQGQPSLVFFGFTSCPEVCPTTLSDIGSWLEGLGADADRLKAIFVSVDSERDNVEALSQYLSPFDPRIVGLTGTPTQLQAAAARFGAYYRRVDQEGGNYTMDHTSMVYLLDARGRFFSTIDYHEDRGVAVAKLRRLLEAASADTP